MAAAFLPTFVVFCLGTVLMHAANTPQASTAPKPPEIVTDCHTPDTYGRLCFPGGRVKAITFSFDDGRV